MGYTTDFDGYISIDPPLNDAEIEYLTKFSKTRRMDRTNGPYFVEGSGFYGQGHDSDVRNHNKPPVGQPGLWCQWVPDELGTRLQWDGGEKFYDSVEWMQYLIDHFLRPYAIAAGSIPGAALARTNEPTFAGFTFNHVLNGVIDAQGESDDDTWHLVVENNVARRVEAADGPVVHRVQAYVGTVVGEIVE